MEGSREEREEERRRRLGRNGGMKIRSCRRKREQNERNTRVEGGEESNQRIVTDKCWYCVVMVLTIHSTHLFETDPLSLATSSIFLTGAVHCGLELLPLLYPPTKTDSPGVQLLQNHVKHLYAPACVVWVHSGYVRRPLRGRRRGEVTGFIFT